ncbi:hypothetical protein C8024_03880 [Sphingopyxis sp. BSNA05]|uniref:hypothetical protein n=1 Tax=Sphingopyxis sp. BSNA05 TaxID=1236614 RepID=UPI001C2694C7|nr:hypothetical protein [Sphingopyxis sp. BSNA05]NRD88778.1 hypothetical protein [Sphingopyxis sp. BSNA05]
MDTSDPHIKILTSIGYICVQWALLEYLVLHSIFAIVDMDEKQGDILFGGLDMQPRLNTALNLAKHHEAPEQITDQIKSIRKAIQGGLSDKRNMAIHGVHADSETPDSVKLHMPRWGGPKRIHTFQLKIFTRLALIYKTKPMRPLNYSWLSESGSLADIALKQLMATSDSLTPLFGS